MFRQFEKGDVALCLRGSWKATYHTIINNYQFPKRFHQYRVRESFIADGHNVIALEEITNPFIPGKGELVFFAKDFIFLDPRKSPEGDHYYFPLFINNN